MRWPCIQQFTCVIMSYASYIYKLIDLLKKKKSCQSRNPHGHASPMKDIHVRPVRHMGCPHPHQSPEIQRSRYPLKIHHYIKQISAVHSWSTVLNAVGRACPSLVSFTNSTKLHGALHMTGSHICSCPKNERLPSRAILFTCGGLNANSRLVGTREWEGVWGWFLCEWNSCRARPIDVDNVPYWSSPIKLSVHASHLSHQLTVSTFQSQFKLLNWIYKIKVYTS